MYLLLDWSFTLPLNFAQMSVWKLRRAVAVVYPSLNITNHQSLSKKKPEAYEKNLISEPTERTLFTESFTAGVCAHDRKYFLSWAQRFHLTRKKVCSHDKKHRRRVLVVKSGRVVYRFLKHKSIKTSEKGSGRNAWRWKKRNVRIGYNRNIYAAGQKNKEWSMSKISHKNSNVTAGSRAL